MEKKKNFLLNDAGKIKSVYRFISKRKQRVSKGEKK